MSTNSSRRADRDDAELPIWAPDNGRHFGHIERIGNDARATIEAMSQRRDTLENFREAAIAWAAGGRGQMIVDAAATALAADVDSPTLRMLAGAPHTSADDEASELAPQAFRELGLDVSERLSPEAYIEAARQQARSFLAGEMSARELTGYLAGFYMAAGYPSDLQTWIGLDDYYDMLRDGVIGGSVLEIDLAVDAAAQDLVHRRNSEPVSVGSLFVAATPRPPRRLRDRVAGILRRRTP